MSFVYILQSDKTGRYYIGSTSDVNRRLEEHNAGQTRSLKNQRPLRIVFHKKYPTSLEARRMEAKLKRFKSRDIIQRIVSEGDITSGGE